MIAGCDLLFLGNEDMSFVMHSLMHNLINKKFKVQRMDVDINNLYELQQMPKFFIVDAEVLVIHSDFRVFLYDKCIEFNRKIVLIGDKEALKKLYDISVTNVIALSCERPINANDVAEQIDNLIRDYDIKGNKRSILVVDDSPVFLRLMAEWLEMDYNINVCPSAMNAFHLIDTNKPDLILLDYEMPVCNGAQFLKMLHSEPETAKIPVMFLTSKDDVNTVKSLIALKPQGYLLKSQSKDSILKKIEEFFIKETIR